MKNMLNTAGCLLVAALTLGGCDHTVGVYKFFGYSNTGDCRVHASYAVYITPIWE